MAVAAPAVATVWVPRPPHPLTAALPPVIRYASPDGSSSPLNPCDDSGNPCALRHAIGSAGRGDEIVVESGDYRDSQTIILGTGLYLHGVAGQPRPRIISSAYGGGAALQVNGPNTRVRYIEIQHVGRGVLLLGASDSVREAVVRTSYKSACEGQADGQTFIDTLCDSAGSSGEAAVGLYTGSANERFYLRNVTAVGGYAGLAPWGGYRGGTGGVEATVVNSVLRGGSYDVYARASSPSFAKVYLSYSNYDRSHSLEQDNSLIWNSGNNQPTPPLFVNPTPQYSSDLNGDYHEALGSPTIDAGQTDDASNGPFDFEGDPRTIGAATDIGADEFIPPAQRTTSGSAGAPAFTSASLRFAVFAADSSGPAARPAIARQAALGTIINYTLSKRAQVRFTIEGVRSGFFGRFAQPGRPGPNSKPWSGKLGRRKLSLGTYRVTLVAVDARGRRSRPKRLTFKVVRP